MSKKTTKRKKLIPIENYAAAILLETLEEIDLSQIAVSRASGIPAPHLSAMKRGLRRFTPEYDLRLSRFLGITPGYFLRLQLRYDLEVAKEKLGDKIAKEVKPAA